MRKGGNDVLLSGKDREVVQMAGQVLASACAMDLHSALERAQAAMHSQQVLGLVEQVSPTSYHSIICMLCPTLYLTVPVSALTSFQLAAKCSYQQKKCVVLYFAICCLAYFEFDIAVRS